MRALTKVALYDDNGNRISDLYDSINTEKSDEFAIVKKVKDGKPLYNFLTEEGKELSKEWFLDVDPFEKEDEAVIVQRVDQSYNLLNRSGKLILRSKKYYVLTPLRNGVARVQNEKRYENYVNSEGKLISKKWFYEVRPWQKGGAEVKTEFGFYNYLKKDGTFLLPRALVTDDLNRKFDLAFSKSKLWVISKPDYEIVSEISCDPEKRNYYTYGVGLINENNEKNILSHETGKLLFDTWKVHIIYMTPPYIKAAEKEGDIYVWYLYDDKGKKLIEQGFIEIEYLSGSFYVRLMKDSEEKRARLKTCNFELEFIE